MPESLPRRIVTSKYLKFMVSAGLLVWVISRFGFRTVLGGMIAADKGFVLYAVGTFIASGMIGAAQWWTLLKFHGIATGYPATLARYFMGLFFNYMLPGFVGGDVVRVYKTTINSGNPARSFSSTLADRVIGLMVLVLFSLGAYALLPGEDAGHAVPVAIFMLAVLAGFITVFAFKPLGAFIKRHFGRFIPRGIEDTVAGIYLETHRLTRAPKTLATVFTLSVIVQFTRIAVHYLCGRAVGIDIGFAYFALFVPLVEIVASLPVSMGGVGVRESMAFILFSTVGQGRSVVVSYTLLATAAGLIGSIPGGVAFILGAGDRK